MKVIVRGTAQAGRLGEETTLLRLAGLAVLRQMAGYIPPQLPDDLPQFQPVSAAYAACVDAIMTCLCRQHVVGANPRSPYLMISWLLLGSDNPFRIRRYVSNNLLVLQLTRLLLRIACGDEPSTDERRVVTRIAATQKVSALEVYSRGWRNTASDEAQDYARTRTDAVATAILRAAGAVNAKMLSDTWVAWSVGAIVSELMRFEGNRVEIIVWKQARKWCYISDDEAGCIVRKLLFEMLDNEN